MQLGGIGDNHSTDMHQVTNCLHSHNKSLEGSMKIPVDPRTAASQALRADQGQQAEFSLNNWLQQLLRSGKQRLLGFWSGNDIASAGDKSGESGKSQTMAQIYDAGVTNSASNAAKDAILKSTPYFAPVTEDPKPVTLPVFQRVKLKCKNVAGQLAQHLPGKFFDFQKKGSSHTKKQNTREDLRRRSKYREDELEIDCVLTDESYLLDSYDRKGEYTQLTTKK